MYGLQEIEINQIRALFSKYPDISSAILYGSRAKGNYQSYSDIDLALVGSGMTLSKLFEIENAVDDLLLPYKIDLSVFEKINNPELVDHINRVGKVLYQSK